MKMFFVIVLFSVEVLSAQTSEALINTLSFRLNGNRVADDIVVGLEVEARKDMLSWRLGKAHVGLSTQYGFSLIGNDNAQIAASNTTYWQYIQGVVGHRFLVFNKRLSFQTSIKFGPSNFRQEATLQDSNLGVRETYEYSVIQLAIYTQLGIGYRFGNYWSLEILGCLPVDNSKLVPKGLGIGLNINIR